MNEDNLKLFTSDHNTQNRTSDRRSERSISVKVPRQQLSDSIDGMIGDSGQHCSQVGFWIAIVQLCCFDQAVDRSCSLASGVRPS